MRLTRRSRFVWDSYCCGPLIIQCPTFLTLFPSLDSFNAADGVETASSRLVLRLELRHGLVGRQLPWTPDGVALGKCTFSVGILHQIVNVSAGD